MLGNTLALPVCARDSARTYVGPLDLRTHESTELVPGLLVSAHGMTIRTERESGFCVPEEVHHRAGVGAERRKQARVRVPELARRQRVGERHEAPL
jgi:hypothetical protein